VPSEAGAEGQNREFGDRLFTVFNDSEDVAIIEIN
jgi:hypothetical protein